MKIVLLIMILVCVAAGLALAGCAGELPDKSGTGSTASTAPASTTSSTLSETYRLGDEVAAIWAESIQKLDPILKNTPPVASIQQQVADLKEQYIQKMVAVGKQIIALNSDEQQTVYDRSNDTMAAMGEATWFVDYQSLYAPYQAMEDETSQEFAVVLASFNTLSEYAFFNLLKDDLPDEAARLGIQ